MMQFYEFISTLPLGYIKIISSFTHFTRFSYCPIN